MLSNPKNYRKVETICPKCKADTILNDPNREETYCTECGYILQDNSILLITQAIEEDLHDIKFIRDLWRKKRKKN